MKQAKTHSQVVERDMVIGSALVVSSKGGTWEGWNSETLEVRYGKCY